MEWQIRIPGVFARLVLSDLHQKRSRRERECNEDSGPLHAEKQRHCDTMSGIGHFSVRKASMGFSDVPRCGSPHAILLTENMIGATTAPGITGAGSSPRNEVPVNNGIVH